MRKLIWKDKAYILNERDYAQLLRRFDVSKIRDGRINILCICHRYTPMWLLGCGECPFVVGEGGGCLEIADGLLGGYEHYMAFHTQGIRLKDYAKGKQAINKIRAWLLSAELLK